MGQGNTDQLAVLDFLALAIRKQKAHRSYSQKRAGAENGLRRHFTVSRQSLLWGRAGPWFKFKEGPARKAQNEGKPSRQAFCFNGAAPARGCCNTPSEKGPARKGGVKPIA